MYAAFLNACCALVILVGLFLATCLVVVFLIALAIAMVVIAVVKKDRGERDDF